MIETPSGPATNVTLTQSKANACGAICLEMGGVSTNVSLTNVTATRNRPAAVELRGNDLTLDALNSILWANILREGSDLIADGTGVTVNADHNDIAGQLLLNGAVFNDVGGNGTPCLNSASARPASPASFPCRAPAAARAASVRPSWCRAPFAAAFAASSTLTAASLAAAV